MKAPTPGRSHARSTSALLYLSGVTVSFDGFKALNNLSLLVEPTSKLHVRLTAVDQTINQRGNSIVDYDIATGKPTEGDLKRQLDVREPYLVNIGLVSADIEYDMGWARLNSVTSAQQEKSRNRLDASFYDGPLTAAVDRR